MNDDERSHYRAVFAKMYETSGYPEGVRPGTSMLNMPFKGGAIRTLPTQEDDWAEESHYEALPEGPVKDPV